MTAKPLNQGGWYLKRLTQLLVSYKMSIEPIPNFGHARGGVIILIGQRMRGVMADWEVVGW
jgi:hypothetical protein